MSPIEELRNRLDAMADLANLTASSEETRSDLAKYLAALDALIAENAAAKALAEKAEAELEQANAVLRYATKTKDQYHSERDALRKALEPLNRINLAQITHGSHICVVLSREEVTAAHAALHSTAKQSEVVFVLSINEKGQLELTDEQPKPRTCGECAIQGTDNCHSPAFSQIAALCGSFQPRADAQKGQP